MVYPKDLELLVLTAAGLAQSAERLTAEREATGIIPGARPSTTLDERTAFALQAAGPSRGSDDHVK